MEELQPNLVEATLDSDIANTDENLSVDQMFQQSSLPSLGKQILSVQQIHGPTAGLFNIKKQVKVEIPAEAQISTGTPTAANSTLYELTIDGVVFPYTSDGTQQVDTIDTITATNGATYTVTINSEAATYVADGTASIAEITLGLTDAINALVGAGAVVTATDNGTSVTITADVGGVAFASVVTAGTMTVTTTTPNNDATIAEIVTGLTLEINVTETNGSVPVTATDNTTDIILTADVPGTAFDVYNSAVGVIGIVLTNPNQVLIAATKNASLVRANVAVYEPIVPIRTDITREAIQDIRATYTKEANNIIGKMLRGLSNDEENIKTLAFLESESLDYTSLTLSDSLNAETNLFEVTQRVQEIVLKMNNKNIRTFEAFAVLPFVALAGIMALSKYAGADDSGERGLFVTKIGMTSYYLSSDPDATVGYVGLKDSDDPSRSSGVFSPYISQVVESTNPDSGQPTFNIYNRFAITASPLHEAGNEMFYKFTIA